MNISKQRRDGLIAKINSIRSFVSAAPQDENTGSLLNYLSELEKEVKSKKYGLVFEEHREGIDDVLVSHTPVLSEETDLFIDNGGQMNFLIEGDNLASLKLLAKTHSKAIDVIFIDPPYNRGANDFIYDDNFIDKTDTFRHSKYISFMKKRLEIAQLLLKNNGAIFINIDDNEFAQLKLLCDSVFGDDNFLACFPWHNRTSIQNDTDLSINHEYILAYAKKRRLINRRLKIHTSKGVILVDCGAPVSGAAMLRETLDYFNVTEPVTHVFITHAHWDHCGSAKELQNAGAKIIVGKDDVPYCENGGVSGMNSPFEEGQGFPAFTPDVTIDFDQTIELNGLSFECIQIPGHTPGSMAVKTLVDRKTLLFTGDALQPDGGSLETISFGWQGDPNFNRRLIVESMLKLTQYETDMVLPGHGKVCLRNGTSILKLAAQTAFTTMR